MQKYYQGCRNVFPIMGQITNAQNIRLYPQINITFRRSLSYVQFKNFPIFYWSTIYILPDWYLFCCENNWQQKMSYFTIDGNEILFMYYEKVLFSPFFHKCKKIPGIIFYCSLSFFEEVVNFVSELDYKKRAALTKSK